VSSILFGFNNPVIVFIYSLVSGEQYFRNIVDDNEFIKIRVKRVHCVTCNRPPETTS